MTVRKTKKSKKEDLPEMSMLEIAHGIMKEAKKPFAYMDLLKKVAKAKKMTKEQTNDRIAYLYTDLNIDGRFVVLGNNTWGLKSWYPLEQIEEELVQAQKSSPRKKKKPAAKAVVEEIDEDFDEYDEDEFEDLEDELDEISNEEDHDEAEDKDTDSEDVDNKK